jgi:hypothetical protein
MHEREIDRLRSALVHVDATLLLFDPATDPEATTPHKQHPQRLHYFAPSEQTRRVFDTIRVHGTVSAGELVDAAMAEKGFPATHRQVRSEFVARFTRTLDARRRRGQLAKIGHGPGVRFKLAPREQSCSNCGLWGVCLNLATPL